MYRYACIVLLALSLVACGPATPPATVVLQLDAPASPGASLPRLAAGPDGDIWLSWVEPGDDGSHMLQFAVLSDQSWGPTRTVAEGTGWFVNWADFPSVTPLADGRLVAHWLVKRPGGTYAYDVSISVSPDGGATWSAPVTPHGDGTATEHGFVSLFLWENDIGAVWLDGRNMSVAADNAPGHERLEGGMTLRAGRIDGDSGSIREIQLDGLVCDCCQTGAAVTGDGVIVVYRDRTTDELRDIAAVRYANGVWSAPSPVGSDGWRIEGCPVNGPAVDARDQRVVVAWFTGADQPRVQVVRSEDGGRNFTTPVQVADGAVLGRVDVAMLDDHSAVVSWLERAADSAAQIRYRRIDTNGAAGPVRILAATSPARSAGFPQMARGALGLVFAWTRVGEPSSVETVTVPLPPLAGG